MLKYLALLLAVTFAAYSRSFYAPFVFDDDYAIMKNPSVNGTAPISIHQPRSVLQTTFRLNYFINGTSVFGYHVVNFALHATNVLLVFGLLSVLGSSSYAALAGAALFSLHPLQSESVIYISARSELLSCFFGLLGMLTFERKRYVWGSVALLFALYSKEIAVVFPLMIGLREALRRKMSLRYLIPIGSFGLAAGLAFATRLESTDRGLGEHVLRQAGQLARFLTMVLVPTGQTLDHDAETLPWAVCVASVVLLIALCIVAYRCRVEYPMVTLGIGWILLAVLPRFVVKTPELMAEHHLYVPMLGISLLFATFFNEKENYGLNSIKKSETYA